MVVIPPVAVTSTKIISSTVAEPDAGEVVYNPSSTYLAGNEVISTTTHKKYKSLQGVQSNVTISIASPAVVTWQAHGLVSGDPIVATTTTGAFPTGIVSGATVYALVTGVDTFNIAATAGGTPIATSGTQSGIHTATSNANTGHALPVPPEEKNDWWVESGATNRMAGFDLMRNTQSVGASPMTIVFAPGIRVASIAALGMIADSITITGTSGGVTVYTKTQNLRRRRTTTPTEYFYMPFEYAPSFLALDVPQFTNLVLTVTLVRSTGLVSLGSLVVGTPWYIGKLQRSSKFGASNFSKIERDTFGVLAKLIPSRTVPKANQTLWIESRYIDRILALQVLLNGVPCLWCGLEDGQQDYFQAFLTLGIYKQWDGDAAEEENAIMTLETEEI